MTISLNEKRMIVLLLPMCKMNVVYNMTGYTICKREEEERKKKNEQRKKKKNKKEKEKSHQNRNKKIEENLPHGSIFFSKKFNVH